MQSSDIVPVSPFSQLPSDCLVQVFDRLIDSDWRSCRGVCKRWRRILLNSPYFKERVEHLALTCLFRSEKQGVICGRIEGVQSRIKLLPSFEGVPSILKISEKERVEIHNFPLGKLAFKGKYCGYHRGLGRHYFEMSEGSERKFWSLENPEELVSDEKEGSDLVLPKRQSGAAGWKIGSFDLWREVKEEVVLNCKHRINERECSFPVGRVFREKCSGRIEPELELCDVHLNSSWLHVVVKTPASSMGRLDTQSFFNYTIVGFCFLSR